MKKIIFTLLKIGVTLLLLYFVFNKIPFTAIWAIIKDSNIYLLIFALIFFTLSQIISANRLWSYFDAISFNVGKNENWKLYLIGMFYNFFIPGGIGGDAYKVFALHKKYNWGVKKLSAAILVDRLVGLLAILILIQLFGVGILPGIYKGFVIFSIALTLIIAKFGFTKFFTSFQNIFLKTLMLSLVIQSLQLLSIYCILTSFSTVTNVWVYGLVFLMSTVLSVLSFSGIGVREWIFMKASLYFNYNVEISVAVALMFTFISAVVSLFGIYYQVRQEVKNNKQVFKS